MKKRAYEMFKCQHCSALKEPLRSSDTYCGDCRDDSMKTVIICWRCEEREVKDETEMCPECHQAADESARDNAVDQAIKSKRENG